MDQGLLPRRYAKALYKFAVDKGAQKDVYTYMQNIENAFAANPRLQGTLANPFVKADAKGKLVSAAAGPGAEKSAVLDDFVKLLVDHRRIDILREIALAYTRLYRKENNIYAVRITSAAPLSDKDAQRIRDLVEKHLHGATAEYTYTVDPDIIGGFVVNIENERLDASVRNELDQLRLILTK